MHHNKALPGLVLGLLGLAPLAGAAESLENLPYAVAGGTPNVDLRLRYENVDQELGAGSAEQASAFTLRSRLGYTTGKWSGLDAQLEFENLTAIGQDDYNSTENSGMTAYPVVADPEGSELNQAWLRYAGPAKTTVKLGRQRLIFDNARFIGNVGWRQREQTYDALLLSNSFIPKLSFDYAYVGNVNSFRSFVIDGKPSTNRDLKGQLVHLSYDYAQALKLSAYDYLLDFQPPLAPDSSPSADSQTWGLRASGSLPKGALRFSYALEYAQQSDYGDSTSLVDADYRLIELGLDAKSAGIKLGYEKLGGDGSYAFQTPLATLHAFQGWADLFLVTPANGLQELYLSLSGKLENVALMARWSQFSADAADGDYGSELDLQATRPLGAQLSAGLKYAAYYGQDAAPVTGVSPIKGDVDKAWAWLEYKF
jgi:hypothetical protein